MTFSENIWSNFCICHILITVYCAEKYVITITIYNIYLHTLYCKICYHSVLTFIIPSICHTNLAQSTKLLWWVPLCHYPAVKSYFPRGKLTFTAPSGVRFNFFVTLDEIIIFIQIKDCNERAISIEFLASMCSIILTCIFYCNKTYDNPVVITPIRKLKAAVSNLHNTGYVKNKNRERKVI